jgi:hypothetical protein
MPFERMAQRNSEIDLVAIAAAFFLSPQIPSLFQFGDDALNGPLRDPHMVCDIS